MAIIERNLQELGKSLFVSLPKEWTNILKLKKGSKVKISYSESGILSIAPEFTKVIVKKEAEINYDEQFRRKFYREYFEGYDKISILSKTKISEKEKNELHSFFKMFMNVQVIEETENKIVIKSFKIEDLSIEECLKRMHFLCLGMLEEMTLKNKTSLKEMRDTMSRFYYMLVMQIRRFLEEGKFAKENQISLVRAMDFRMVAEKIQRIAEIADNYKEKNMNKELIKTAIDYYSKAVFSFLTPNFEKALALWSEEKLLKRKLEKKNNEELAQIVRYSKEISMLIR
jgi:phosphate uptake regulator